jgi:7-cyano-7-deazaguanine tRNA-ribosyltransferase
MHIVAGLSLKNLSPAVWDRASLYHLPALREVMVSYAEFDRNPAHHRRAMEQGIHTALGIPQEVRIYLDNGAFYFSSRNAETDVDLYQEFVTRADPDWRPIAQDFIPSPEMTLEQQRQCLTRTMALNSRFEHDGYVPVIHISRVLQEYIDAVLAHERLAAKPAIAIGAMVPNLLRAPKAMAYREILDSLGQVRQVFQAKALHVFGIGGTATLHLAALLGMDSVDSSGWRNRAARGIVQLPGCGDRMIADLGSWRGRKPSGEEWDRLGRCPCPACVQFHLEGLQSGGKSGFCNRATHNLWILLEEARWIEDQMRAGTYLEEFPKRLDNSIYLPLIQQVAAGVPAGSLQTVSGSQAGKMPGPPIPLP